MSRLTNVRGSGSIVHRRVELRPVGADGSAAVVASLGTGPAVLRFIAVDYQNQPATTDIVVKSDDANGDTLLTLTSQNTDIAPRPVSLTAGVDEGAAALAATDGSAGGMPVRQGLYFSLAEGDGQTSGDEVVVIDVWYEEVEYIRVRLVTEGADGAATASRLVTLPGKRPGIVRAIAVDYQNEPATTDVVIKADVAGDLTGGTTVFTRTSSATDIPISPTGMPGGNETNAALAATDASDGGWPFKSNLYITVAEADGFAGGGNELILVDLWIDG
jgi:hypothetical protein